MRLLLLRKLDDSTFQVNNSFQLPEMQAEGVMGKPLHRVSE
jgi:hypothetical protein